jgi:4-carboxymuconolactone decarboxylase
LTRDDCTDEQRALWDRVTESRGRQGLDMTDATGSLMGPFHAMAMRPAAGEHMAALGGVLRFRNAAPNNLLEIAICTVGAHWKSEFEFWAHRRMAVDAGVSEAALDAIAAGESPSFDDDAERLVFEWASSLVTTGHTTQAQYDGLVAAVGVDAVIDLTLTCGYYCQVSFLLNAFDVQLPDGATPTWA